MSVQQRKDEILAKKAKLAELRRTRELRDAQKANRGLEAPGSGSESAASTTPNRRESRRELDDLISSLVDRPQSGRVSREGSPASKGSRPSSFYGSGQVLSEATSPGRKTPNRSSLQYVSVSSATQTLPDEESQGTEVATPRAEPAPVTPKPEYVTYSVGVQTDPLSPGDDGDPFSDLDEPGSPGAFRTPKASKRMSRKQQDREAELRENLRQEIEAELKSIKEPGAEDKDGDAAKQRFPARALTTDEVEAVTASEDFSDFVERSSKVIERALEDEYDLLADYALAGGAEVDDEDGYGRGRGKGRRIKEVARFYDEKWSKRRMISDINFSPKFPELVLAAYARASGLNVDYAGCVQVWNMHMHARPEYVFHSTSDVLTAKFSPFHPSYVIGGTYSGQVLLWDTRSKSTLPVSKTPLSGANAGGHTHPVYSVDIVGTQNANNIISCSTDGIVCGWTTDMLQQPQEFLELTTPAGHSRIEELSPTCMAFPPADPTSFFVGTEEGSMYSCHRYDRAGAKAGVDNRIRYRGHTAPVMSLDFHSARGPVDLSDLVLTTSLDWTVKLWRARTAGATAAGAAAAATTSNSSSNNSGSGAGGSTGAAASTAALSSSGSGGGGSGGGSGSSSSGIGAGVGIGAGGSQEISAAMDFSRDDVVYDARWSPARPAVFALVDGAGSVEVWDLLADTEIPVAKAAPTPDKRVDSSVRPVPVSLNKVAWDAKDGRRLAVGGASGLVTAFELGSDLSAEGGRPDEWAALKRLVGRAEREMVKK